VESKDLGKTNATEKALRDFLEPAVRKNILNARNERLQAFNTHIGKMVERK